LLQTSLSTSAAEPELPVEPAPLAASAGEAHAPPVLAEPVDAWLDLMEVIEALCPRWPTRSLPTGTDYRL
jgi:hypothetical protein